MGVENMMRYLTTALLLLLLVGCNSVRPQLPTPAELEAMGRHEQTLVMIRIVGSEGGKPVDLLPHAGSKNPCLLNYVDLSKNEGIQRNVIRALDEPSWEAGWCYI